MSNPIKNWRRQKTIRDYLDKEGTVQLWTVIGGAYAVVMVELDDGYKMYGKLVDYEPESLKTGLRVRSTLRVMSYGSPEDVITYGVSFIPA
jgi:uncharacterized OB-fold protein